MEMTAIYIYGAIGAIFCLVIGTLIGYAICEGQQLHANALQREHLESVDTKWRQMLSSAQLAASGYKASWEYADKYREAIVEALDTHGLMGSTYPHHTPRMMLVNLLGYVSDCSLDPKLSQKAKNLYVKGVRAGAKKGRAQMQKLMQKSIDNQAATINEYMKGLAASRIRYGQFILATRNVLDDKIALPGVRRALRKAISVEVTRMRTANVATEAV